jgi:hypothetical protein
MTRLTWRGAILEIVVAGLAVTLALAVFGLVLSGVAVELAS